MAPEGLSQRWTTAGFVDGRDVMILLLMAAVTKM
jgi:hypothetical protein